MFRRAHRLVAIGNGESIFCSVMSSRLMVRKMWASTQIDDLSDNLLSHPLLLSTTTTGSYCSGSESGAVFALFRVNSIGCSGVNESALQDVGCVVGDDGCPGGNVVCTTRSPAVSFKHVNWRRNSIFF